MVLIGEAEHRVRARLLAALQGDAARADHDDRAEHLIGAHPEEELDPARFMPGHQQVVVSLANVLANPICPPVGLSCT